MDSERYARLKRVFARAYELPSGERADYLAGACSGDEPLRIEVEELLESAEESSDDAIDHALANDEGFELSRAGSMPRRIGRYRILGVHGTGGMGTVFEAQQESPLRRVAIKVIHSAVPRPELLRRFERESEILARLQHPGIAHIFEAGEFEQDGVPRPYIAMEFVDGAPLLEFAREHALDVGARLDLFLRVCDAIHYAHDQGVVHRDLKPDNILVVASSSSGSMPSRSSASSAQPKILDFGVARLADPDVQVTRSTGAGQLLGSVPYMSPEQAAGAPDLIDPRSDVYSLGVVLFELLTGRLPQDVRKRALSDALHAIRHDEPSRLGSADPDLRGDLETIVGKCLEKDRERRYGSVANLVEDLLRYQELKPVNARPPSTWYQLKKFTQRNRALVGGAATTILAIVGGAILALLFAVRATHHAGVAREAQARSERAAYRAHLGAASALLDSDPAHARRILDGIPTERRGWEWRLLASTSSSFLLEFGEVRRRARDRFHNVPGEDMHLLANTEEVVALSADDEFRVWRTRTGEVVRTFSAPEAVGVFAASRAGNLLAAALEGGRVVTCDPREEEPTWTTWFESDTLVDALAVAPAGDRIAIDRPTEVRFGTPAAWHVVETGVRDFELPPALEFSHDGTQLARLYGNALLLDVATGERIGQPMESGQVHWAMAIAPDRRRVALGQKRRELRIFDPLSGELDFQLLGHTEQITDVAYGPGNRLLSSSKLDGTIRVWDLERREQIAIFDAPQTTRAEFLDDDHILSLSDGRFWLWTLRDRRARELVGHDAHVFGAVFSGDGELLVSSAPWGDIIVWDVLEGTPLHRAAAEHRDHFLFDREGESVLHDVQGGRYPLFAEPWYGGPKISLAAPPARPRLHHSWHFQSGELRVQGAALPVQMQGFHVFRTEHGAQPDAEPPAAYIDGEELALSLPHTSLDLGPHPLLWLGHSMFSGSIAELIVFDGRLSAADARAVDLYLTARRAGASEELPAVGGVLAHFRADERTVQRSETGGVRRWIAANDSRLVLDAQGGPQMISFVAAVEGQPAHLQFVQDWNVLNWLEMPFPRARDAESLTVCWLGAFGAETRAPHAADWTAYSIESIGQWADHDERITRAGPGSARSPDGRYHVEILPHPRYGSGFLVVRDVATGHCVSPFQDGQGAYCGVSFYQDSRRLACAGTDGRIDIFDVQTRELVTRFEAHEGPCYDVAFSPDGKLLASAGNDNALRLWDAETHEALLELPGHRSYVRCLNWSADGSMLVSGSGDFGVRIWDAMPREQRHARKLAARALLAEVTAELESLEQDSVNREAVLAEIQQRWADDPARRRSALKALAVRLK